MILNNLMSFQDFVDKSMGNGNLSLDSNRENLNCLNFNFSSEKINDINNFDSEVKKHKLLSQSQAIQLFEKLYSETDFYEKQNIKEEIFMGYRRLIHNYLISRSKYELFKDETVSEMVRDGEQILSEAIESYKIGNQSFSEYLFKLFAQKTMNDLYTKINEPTLPNEPSITEQQATNELDTFEEFEISEREQNKYGLPSRIYENLSQILSKLKGKSVVLCKKNFVKVEEPTLSEDFHLVEPLNDIGWENNFQDLDDYFFDIEGLEEKGKIR